MIQDISTLHSQVLADRLKTAKKPDPSDEKALKEACQGFEAIFTKSLLDSMRSTLPGDALFPESNGKKIFESMYDQELAGLMSKASSGTGLKAFLYEQLKK